MKRPIFRNIRILSSEWVGVCVCVWMGVFFKRKFMCDFVGGGEDDCDIVCVCVHDTAPPQTTITTQRNEQLFNHWIDILNQILFLLNNVNFVI